MEHLLLKAATTATDEGVFEAVISTPTVDRVKDIVEPQAMVTALQKWAAIGKLVPLAWSHTDEVVGTVDPSTVRVENDEVIVKGQIDRGTDRGVEAWRLVKSGTLSFSFGYLIPDGGATKRPGGGLQIKELDVFEISVVPVAPANNDTRVLSFKSLEQANEVIGELQEVKARLDKLEKALENREKAVPADETQVDPLRKEAQRIALDIRSGGLPSNPPVKQAAKPEPKPEPEFDPDTLRARSRDLMLQVLSGKEST